MPINTNTINKIRYTIYTPIYNTLTKTLEKSRQLSIQSLHIKQGANVLIIGAGTGLDFQYLSNTLNITATDLTPLMVYKMKKRYKNSHLNATFIVMDGHQLAFKNEQFDVVILHLILAVIPNPYKAIQEVERVLKPKGKVAIFDKFIPQKQTISFKRKILNLFTKFLFSDINRNIEEIVGTSSLKITSTKPANFNGIFKRILLEKR